MNLHRRVSLVLLKTGCGVALFLAAVFLYILIFQLSLPTELELRGMYSAAHPTRLVTDIYSGEGDASAVYYHIHYEDRGSSRAGEDVWLFLRKSDEWILSHMETDVSPGNAKTR